MSDEGGYLSGILEAPGISTPVLHVDIDALALLAHFDNDEQAAFDFLGKLKDLFAS